MHYGHHPTLGLDTFKALCQNAPKYKPSLLSPFLINSTIPHPLIKAKILEVSLTPSSLLHSCYL